MAFQAAMRDEGAFRNFKEFLETYNKISETCFNSCIPNLNSRELTPGEISCTDLCAGKNMTINHKILSAFMVEQPKMTEQKIEKAEAEARNAMEKLEAQGIDAKNLSPEEMAKVMMEGMQSPNKPSN